MARKDFADGSEDTQALVGAYNTALESYKSGLGTLSASDMVQAYDGDRSALARALAGLPATGKIADLSKREQGKYRDQYKNVSRWLNYESGQRGPQARNIARSRVTQNKIKDLYARKFPPRGSVTASITGWIGYNGDWRYRSIDIPAMGKSVDTEAFNAAMQAGDTRAAMQALFDAYASAVTVAQADSFTISYEEEE